MIKGIADKPSDSRSAIVYWPGAKQGDSQRPPFVEAVGMADLSPMEEGAPLTDRALCHMKIRGQDYGPCVLVWLSRDDTVEQLKYELIAQEKRYITKGHQYWEEAKTLELQHDSAVKEPLCKKAKIAREKVELSIGNAVIVADKQRLIQACPYFASLLRFHADDNMDAVSLIPPENVDLDIFLAVLHSLSNANVNLDISRVNLWDFIVLSKYFQLEQLEKQCMLTFRKFLPILEIDELCRFWRKGHSSAFGEITALAVTGISLKMENAGQSQEFLGLAVEELAALLSSKGFLPLMEKDVYKAAAAWCEHDPENRKTTEILKPILVKVVQNACTKHLFESFDGQCEKPNKAPKRAGDHEHNWICSDELLGQLGCVNGVVVGNYLYTMYRGFGNRRRFSRIDLNNKERTEIDSFRSITFKYEGEEELEPAEYRLCLVKLASGDMIGCCIPYEQMIHYVTHSECFCVWANLIILYDPVADQWWRLPKLPLPRTQSAMIQLGSFLYLIGGLEHRPKGCGPPCVGDNAHHCYRLGLSKLPGLPEEREWDVEWQRIADLNAPRIGHRIQLKYGRIIACGGQTVTKVDEEGNKQFEDAQWSEAYDSTLNIWTVFKQDE